MILQMEMTQVNTNHPDFVGSRRTLGQLIAKVSNEVVPQNQGGDDDDDDDTEDDSDDSEDDDDDDDEDEKDDVMTSTASDGSQIFKIEVIETILLKKLLKSYFRVVRCSCTTTFSLFNKVNTHNSSVGTQKSCRLDSESDTVETRRQCTSYDAIRIGRCTVHQRRDRDLGTHGR